jgi:hypothetical protein
MLQPGPERSRSLAITEAQPCAPRTTLARTGAREHFQQPAHPSPAQARACARKASTCFSRPTSFEAGKGLSLEAVDGVERVAGRLQAEVDVRR